jgi:molybdopterin molybdotransferase
VTAARATPVQLGIARDNEESLRAHLERALDADALVTTAGASVGDHDVVKDVLEAMGMRRDFWRVQMRPGSPFSFGVIEREAGGLPVFGLPGNPVSALVTFETLVKPALRRMLGRTDVHTPTRTVRAAERIESKPGLVHFLRVTVVQENGEAWVRLTGPQGSGVLTSMAAADALLVVPLDVKAIEKDARATAITLEQTDAGQNEPGY